MKQSPRDKKCPLTESNRPPRQWTIEQSCSEETNSLPAPLKRSKSTLKLPRKNLTCAKVLEIILSPRKRKLAKAYATLDQQISTRETSKELDWGGISTYSSASSLIIVHEKLCTSSPVCQPKSPSRAKTFANSSDPSDDVIIGGMSPDGRRTTMAYHDTLNESFCETKSSSREFEGIIKISSKSESELFPVVDVDRDIEDFSRSNRMRQSYPGMSNTTRRESCQALLKCIASNMTNMKDLCGAEQLDKSTSSLDTIQDSSEGFHQQHQESSTTTPMRQALLEIARRRSFYTSESADIMETESFVEGASWKYSNSVWNMLRNNLDGVREDLEENHQDGEQQMRKEEIKSFGDGFDGFDQGCEYLEGESKLRNIDNAFPITICI